jgi:hypothetical protein
MCGETGEIEVTSGMLAAGVSAFLAYDPRFEGEEESVTRIYRAMVRARLLPDGRLPTV